MKQLSAKTDKQRTNSNFTGFMGILLQHLDRFQNPPALPRAPPPPEIGIDFGIVDNPVQSANFSLCPRIYTF